MGQLFEGRETNPVAGGIQLSEIISALSFALDLTEDAVPGHALRTCVLGMRIGERCGLDREQRRELYYALLLKDAGCSNNAARMYQVFSGDDRAVKSGSKMIDWAAPRGSNLPMLSLLLKEVRPGESLVARIAHIVRMAVAKQDFSKEFISLRCERGADIVGKIGVGPMGVQAVWSLDEHWSGRGYPDGLAGEQIPLLARIAAVAQYLDIFGSVHGVESALNVLKERSGRWFDPALVEVALALSQEGRLWEHSLVGDPELQQAVLDMEPSHPKDLEDADIDRICEAFADVVDAKSPFTYRHSIEVAAAARGIAITMGLSAGRARMLNRAGLLHDIGKLRVPNSILDKPGRLTAEEFLVVKEHPGISREILARVKLFSEIAEISGDHHERLDGSGYPNGKNGDQLPLESRILQVADVYGALSENRPYRPGMDMKAIQEIMEKDVPLKLDSACYEALLAWVSGERHSTAADEPSSAEELSTPR